MYVYMCVYIYTYIYIYILYIYLKWILIFFEFLAKSLDLIINLHRADLWCLVSQTRNCRCRFAIKDSAGVTQWVGQHL